MKNCHPSLFSYTPVYELPWSKQCSNFDDQHLNFRFEIISLSSHIEIEINEAQGCQLALKKRGNFQNAHDFAHGYAHGALVLYKVI